ncbi:MAG: glycosyltransferase family 2 protein [Cyclobacteriaceae bacterium]|nr:glycosyltransferase family 2 protein [Cyclobacteriaceae bacterium]
MRRKKNSDNQGDAHFPAVTLMIAAYNEERFIESKIKNSLGLDYPPEKLNVWIVADGSTDHTIEISKRFSEVKTFYQSARMGKIHAVNRVMKLVETPIVIFSDANTTLNHDSIKNIVRHFNDKKVGGVAGEKQITSNKEDNASGSGEGLYWKYESALKKMDSNLTTAIGAAGELFALRTELYHEPEPDTIIEDFVTSMKIVAKGYRFVYEPDACAIETASATIKDEWKRKVRISGGGIQAIMRLPELLNPFRYGLISWQYISHRVLRWTFAPLALPIILITNILLYNNSLFYQLCLVGQVLFYFVAIIGHLLREKKIGIKGFFIPYYFCMMNLSVFAGIARLLRKQQTVIWEKSERA